MTRPEASTAIPALFTDLYELTMAQACLEEGLSGQAVFSLFVRRLPPARNYLLACGLGTVLDYLERLRFTEPELAYLASLNRFSDSFIDWLRAFRFTGTVHAVAEGTPVFANEPILELSAPLPQAQLVETCVMNQIHVQTVLGSKAQRMVSAARGRPVIDFGARRTHGVDAALKAARAFHIAGVAGTSNLLAGWHYGVPVSGTMAHSYIQAHPDEATAYRAFAKLYPDTVLLVDTYDTLAGVDRVIELARELGANFRVSGVRLDSGDLAALARETRARLDRAGLTTVRVIASGGLDEQAIAELLDEGAPIDAFGVGTSMGVAPDAPDLDIAYKLCEYAGEGRLKLSPGKPILPGRKQVFRQHAGGEAVRDVIARADETFPGEALLALVMQGGNRLPAGRVPLDAARGHAARSLARLPAPQRGIAPAETPYPVAVSERLEAHQQAVEARLRGTLRERR